MRSDVTFFIDYPDFGKVTLPYLNKCVSVHAPGLYNGLRLIDIISVIKSLTKDRLIFFQIQF